MPIPFVRRYSLKYRVALAMAVVFLAFAGVLVQAGLQMFESQYRRSLALQQNTLATAISATVDEKLQSAQQMLVNTASLMPAEMFGNALAAQRFLDQQTVLQTVFDHSLLMVTTSDIVIADTPALRGRNGASLKGRLTMFDHFDPRRPQISRPYASLYTRDKPVLLMTAPVIDHEGRLRGTLAGALDLLGHNYLADLQKYRIGQTGWVTLVTLDRMIISNPDASRILQPAARPGQNRLLDRALEGFEGSELNTTSRGVRVLTTYKRLQSVPWLLAINLPVEEAEGPLRQAQRYFFLAALAGTLLVLGIVWLIMKRSLAPLERLTAHVRTLPQLPRGERTLTLRAAGELETLVQSFNAMVDTMERQQQEVEASEARFRSLTEMSTDWYWEQDTDFRFTLMSRGVDKTNVTTGLGEARWDLPIVGVSPEQWAEHRAMLDRHEPFRDFVYQVRAVDGTLRTFSIAGTPMFDAQGTFTGYRGIGSDITERKATEQRIEYLAYHDALTGLPNRLLVQDRFEQAMAQAERAQHKVALVYLDLDNFKAINDSLGHAAGDELLKEVAQRLRRCVRDSDTISRQGGDEFLLVLRDLPDTEIVSTIVIKLIERLQAPIQLGEQELSTSASVGVAIGPDDGRDFETLRKKADMAMYRSKESGRNTYHFFDPTMDTEASEHLQLRNGLRRALERNEFILYFQPQYELLDGRLVGVEALLRWQHPERGLVAPGHFIGVAEESGLIVPLGEWVLREACRQAMDWRKAGLPPVTMSVNLSAIQFRRGDIEQSVLAALAESGLPPAQLELELTESMLIQNVESVVVAVRQLKQHGVQLSIDDFGTGYSSLSYLKRFDIDRLKIDQSFVRDLTSDPDDAAIVRAIIQMAQSLNLQTIAEGVETAEMAQQLRAYGCDQAQGYHYARPMPADQLAQLLASLRS